LSGIIVLSQIKALPGQREGGRLPGIRTLNIAHRGASSLAPENTIPAFDKALEIGVDGLEFDVQLSKDNIPVIIHDESLDRTTTGQGPVKDHALAELKKFDAGAFFAPRFSGAAIPALDEVLSRYRNENLLFNIELKNAVVSYPGIEEAVLECIGRHNLEEKTLISSFNHDSLVTCRRINPAVRTGLLYIEDIREPWHYVRSLGCYSAHPLFFYLQDPAILAGFKEHGIPLYPWTVNDPSQMEIFAAQGIEAIITDYPRELKKILGRL